MAVRIPVNGPEVGHVAHPVDILRHDGQALEKKLIIRVMAKNYFLRLVMSINDEQETLRFFE